MKINEAKKINLFGVVERSDKSEAIKRIEGRSQKELIALLKWNGIGGIKSHQFHDYSQAKKLIFEDLFINSDIYDKQIGWIVEYLKI